MKQCATCRSSFPTDLEVCPQDGTPLGDSDSWLPGTVVRGKYVIFSKIAESRTSAVYKARDLGRDQPRAVKALRADLAQDAPFIKRFKNEALIARRLRHPNIARIETSDQSDDGRPFLVMEYVDGRTLKRAVQEEGRFAAARVCAIAKQIAAALDAAHRLGVVHGDLNATSVLLIGPSGAESVKVLGFWGERVRELGFSGDRSNGAARQFQDFMPAAPEYASPEQALGKRGDELDGRADLYSLGVLMYEMLASTPPFQGFSSDLTLEVLLAQIELHPEPLAATSTEVPQELASLVARLLEKRRELRPATAKTLMDEIDRAEQALTTAAPAAIEVAEGAAAEVPPAAVEQPPVDIASPAPLALEQAILQAEPQPAPERILREFRIDRSPSHSILFRTPDPPKKDMFHGWWIATALVAVALGLGGWWTFSIYRPESAGGLRHELGARWKALGSSLHTKQDAHAVSKQGQPEIGSMPASIGQDDRAIAAPIGQDSGTAGYGGATSSQVPAQSAPVPAKPASEPARQESGPATHRAASPTIDGAEVRRVLAEGDTLFERGDYDRAILVYEGPLKLDPNIPALRHRIERARRARAAEEKYLGP